MAKTNASFNPLNMSAVMQDAFRTLRMNVSFSGGDNDIQSVVVTSAIPSEGKTSVSVGLGVAMAEAGRRTLLIECDCRRPAVGNRIKLRPALNWLDVLYRGVPLDEAIVETACPGLCFLDAEPELAHSIEQLSSVRFRKMVEDLKKQFGFIIFDTPPLGSFIEAATLSKLADGTILVVTSGSKEVRLLKQTVEQIKKAQANLLGVVLNKVHANHTSYYYKYGDYYYRNQGKKGSKSKRRVGDPLAHADSTNVRAASAGGQSSAKFHKTDKDV